MSLHLRRFVKKYGRIEEMSSSNPTEGNLRAIYEILLVFLKSPKADEIIICFSTQPSATSH
jgi:hypothetical protein